MKFKDFLNEAPLPDKWDKDKFKGRLDFKGMVEYAIERSKVLGKGSSRIAFEIEYEGRSTALKIAMNPAGIAQNEQESKYLNDSLIVDLGITIPIIDFDTTNIKPRWIHTEMADSIDEDVFIKIFGIDLKNAITCIVADNNVMAPQSELTKNNMKLLNRDNDLYRSIKKLLVSNPDILYGDIARIVNWGLYKNKPVILDIGYDSVSSKIKRLK